MNFLIIRLESIGDIVLTTPIIRCLKKQVPEATIHYLVKPQFKVVMETNPYVDKLHILERDENNTIDKLKEEKIDYIIDLQHNSQSLRVKKSLKRPSFSVDHLRFEKFVFTKLKWNVMPKTHIVDRYFETVAPFGVHNDGEGLDYVIPREETVPLSDIPAAHHAGFISIVIGASFRTKKLPVHKLQELCQKINHPIILLGGKEERQEGETIASDDPIKIYNACGKFSLHESADLLLQSKLVIAHDTGLMHIATALKKPVIAIWGSTTPSLGMVPYYGQHFLQRNAIHYENVQVHKLWCRPCSEIGRHKCPQGHFKCMKKIDIDDVVAKVNQRIKQQFTL